MLKNITIYNFIKRCGIPIQTFNVVPINMPNVPDGIANYNKQLIISKAILKNYKNMLMDLDVLDLYDFDEDETEDHFNNRFYVMMKDIINTHRWQIDKLSQVENFIDEIGITGLSTTNTITKSYGDQVVTTDIDKTSSSSNTTIGNGSVVGATTTFDSSNFKDTNKTTSNTTDTNNYNGAENTDSSVTTTKNQDIETSVKNYMIGLNLPDYLQNEIIMSRYDFIGIYARILVSDLILPLWE